MAEGLIYHMTPPARGGGGGGTAIGGCTRCARIALKKSTLMPSTSHIQRSPAEFVDRPKVAEISHSPGSRAYFVLKINPVTFRTELGRRPLD